MPQADEKSAEINTLISQHQSQPLKMLSNYTPKEMWADVDILITASTQQVLHHTADFSHCNSYHSSNCLSGFLCQYPLNDRSLRSLRLSFIRWITSGLNLSLSVVCRASFKPHSPGSNPMHRLYFPSRNKRIRQLFADCLLKALHAVDPPVVIRKLNGLQVLGGRSLVIATMFDGYFFNRSSRFCCFTHHYMGSNQHFQLGMNFLVPQNTSVSIRDKHKYIFSLR